MILFFLAFAAVLSAQPSYRAVRTLDPIRIDGKLDEFTWAAAPRVGRFYSIRGEAGKPIRHTEASIVWDNENLYVSFVCEDPEPWGRMARRDDRLWEEEVVEVFLDPDGDGQNYPELEVSPNNVVVDLLIPRPRSGIKTAVEWDIAGLQTAVGRNPKGWITEIAIPWRSLAGAGRSTTPAPGDRWRVGLYRIERPGGPARIDKIAGLAKELKSAAGTRKEEIEAQLRDLQAIDQYQAWAPTSPERGFHDPERFGFVEFVD